MINAFRIENEKLNAYEIADLVIKKTGIVKILKNEGIPENISKIENIEELLNGIKDFTDGQIELADSNGSVTEFLEDVSLATDFDNDDDGLNTDKVSLMTIHLAKGLEFSEVFIVGLEEDLLPSAMSLNTREELEEERRLFYVAITRAKERAHITFTKSRFRWGKLVEVEPSRFLDELDSKYVDRNYMELDKSKNIINSSILSPFSKKTSEKDFNSINKPSKSIVSKLKSINDLKNNKVKGLRDDHLNVKIGMNVEHGRFGKGKVLSIEGAGNDKKAIIEFQGIGIKNLLLKYAKLKTID
tara:strand:- start:76 stop:975 length:900 start_codon:yes stop_codon:yes gene_type:complete